MIEQKFKPGDVVMLRSGGPQMTVKCYEPKDGFEVTCTWFDNKTLEEKSFLQDLLDLDREMNSDDIYN